MCKIVLQIMFDENIIEYKNRIYSDWNYGSKTSRKQSDVLVYKFAWLADIGIKIAHYKQ